MNNNKVLRLVQLSIFSAISIVLLLFIRFPIIPSAPFLIYDMADVAILIAALLFGVSHGLVVLLISCLFQMIFLGGNGWIGFIMHFIASGTLVIITGLFYGRFKNLRGLIIGIILGGLAMALIMIPMNYIFTVNFFGIPKEVFYRLIFTAIVPFNLIKSILNGLIAMVLFKALAHTANKR